MAKSNQKWTSKSKYFEGVTYNPYSYSIHDPPISFSQTLKINTIDDQFSQSFSIFEQLHILKYARFLKDILSNKRRLEEQEIVMLMKKCTSML